MRILFLILISFFLTNLSNAENITANPEQLRSKCDDGEAKACARLGVHYVSEGGLLKNRETILSLFEKACTGGAGAGCTFFGYTQFEGVKRKERDFAKAREYYKLGCDAGHAYGCTLLGFHYEMAWEVEQDYNFARTKYEKACSLGDFPACAHLGRMYERGIGITKNAEQAQHFFERSCELGNRRVCEHINKPMRKPRLWPQRKKAT